MTYIVGATVEIPATFTVTATGALADPTTLTLTVRSSAGADTVYAYPSANIVRDSVGTYRGIVVPTLPGEWVYEWVSTGVAAGVTDGSFDVRESALQALPTLTVTYATVAQLRTELGLDDETLTDTEAKELLLNAEDLIDGLLGAWPIDETTGRKIVAADVDAWQFAKLTRATLKTAANLHRSPKPLVAAQYRRVKGPDFEFEDLLGGTLSAILTPNIVTILNDSGLRNIAGRAQAGPRPRIRADYDRFLRATRHDGT